MIWPERANWGEAGRSTGGWRKDGCVIRRMMTYASESRLIVFQGRTLSIDTRCHEPTDGCLEQVAAAPTLVTAFSLGKSFCTRAQTRDGKF